MINDLIYKLGTITLAAIIIYAINRLLNSKTEAELKANQEEYEYLKIKRELDKKHRERDRKREIYMQRLVYKNRIDIYEIFYTDRSLPWRDVVKKIKVKFDLSQKQAEDLFETWRSNRLIIRSRWDKREVEIGEVLSQKKYMLDEMDYTREKWLADNNLILKPIS